MARLSQPPDTSYTTPAAGRVHTGTQLDMASPPLYPLPLGTSLQSHGNDNLPTSPLRRSSGRSSLSPADCRTLEKILSDVASPPATSSPHDQSDQLFLDGRRASTEKATEKKEDHQFVGGEATDTGYEDEDDSMELSEGGEVVTAKKTITSLGDPTSPSVSKSDRRLQDSVSAHDEKERMRYSGGRRSSTMKREKAKRAKQEHITPLEATEGDTIEDVMNIPGKRAPSARPSDLGHSDPDRQAVPDDIKQLNRMRLSMEKVLEHELVEQERAESEEEPGVFIPASLAPQDKAKDLGESGFNGFDADKEDAQPRFCLGILGGPRRKISRSNAAHSERQSSPVVPWGATAETAVLVPSTPTPAAQTLEPAHIQFSKNQSVAETPFTKTLSYFKQYKGAKNSPSKRRRNTAMPQDITEVAESAVDPEFKTGNRKHGDAQPAVRNAGVSTATSALADLEAMARPNRSIDAASTALPPREEDVAASTDISPEQTANENDTVIESAVDDAQKQIILYPQHPAFFNAIGMIPATMFWATAAPIVKYTNIAVELLIDKLMDTYL